jgi:hypothetical protein
MTSSGEVRKMNFVLGRDCSGSPARAARWKAALITGPSVSGSCTKILASSAKEREVGAGSPEGRAMLCRRPLDLSWLRKEMKGWKRMTH